MNEGEYLPSLPPKKIFVHTAGESVTDFLIIKDLCVFESILMMTNLC